MNLNKLNIEDFEKIIKQSDLKIENKYLYNKMIL